jgi:hypothetical protein
LKNFIKDDFFGKGHLFTKAWQFFITLIMWLPVLLPIIITANSTIFRKSENTFYRWDYQGGFRLYQHLTVELALFLVAIFIVAILLAHRTNYRTEHMYQQKIMYNEAKLAEKSALLEEFYDERFGNASFRENVKFYSVASEQNMPDDFVRKEFQKIEE